MVSFCFLVTPVLIQLCVFLLVESTIIAEFKNCAFFCKVAVFHIVLMMASNVTFCLQNDKQNRTAEVIETSSQITVIYGQN